MFLLFPRRKNKERQEPQKWAFIVIVIIVVTGLALNILNRNKRQKGARDVIPETQGEVIPPDFFENFPSELLKNKPEVDSGKFIRKASLSNAKNSLLSGEAFVTSEQGTFRYHLAASLPELIQGYNYEGWLIRKNPRHIMSIGPLSQKENHRGFELDFSTNLDYKDYSVVRVTIERGDGNPEESEAVVLEGELK